MEYQILIEKLSIKAIIGVLKIERNFPQQIDIQAKITYEFCNNNFLNYVAIKETIIKDIKQKEYFLLEQAFEGIVSVLKKSFPEIKKIELTLKKPNVLDDCVVGIHAVK